MSLRWVFLALILVMSFPAVGANQQWVLDINKSTNTHLVYYNPQTGKTMMVIDSPNGYYFNGTTWLPVNLTFRQVPQGYVITENNYQVFVNESTIKVSKDGVTVDMTPQFIRLLTYSPSGAQFYVKDNTFYWNFTLPVIDTNFTLLFTVTPSRLEKKIIIWNKPNIPSFLLPFLSGVKLSYFEDFRHSGILSGREIIIQKPIVVPTVTNTSNGSVITNTTIMKNYTVFKLSSAYVVDAKGNKRQLIDTIANRYSIDVDFSWLLNATYPVIIDPGLEVTADTTLCGNYTYDYISISAAVYVCDYDGTAGTGVLNLTATTYINITSTGNITGIGAGYRGGAGGDRLAPTNGEPGEGPGGGGGGTTSTTDDGAGGGGAGHYGAGGKGGDGTYAGGGGGASYGDNTISYLMGSGGGGGGGEGSFGSNGGPGGDGGAGVYLEAPTIIIQSIITVDGENGDNPSAAGGGGGGSGGTIVLYGDVINLTSATLSAKGGAGADGGTYGGGGGGGSGGRIKIFYNTLYNTSSVAYYSGGTGGAGGAQQSGAPGSDGILFINALPTPSQIKIQGYGETEQGILRLTNHTPLIEWVFSDADAGDSQTGYEVEVWTGSGGTGTKLWDTGWVNSSSQSVVYSGNTLQDGQEYYLRIRLWDNSNVSGIWQEVKFRMNTKPSWGKGDFKYRRPITVDRGGASNLTDYQLNVTIDTASLISAGKLNSDCSDIRFYDDDDITKLPYYLESGCNTSATLFWVKLSDNGTQIYMYYGNPSAVSESNGSAAFDLFDDFEGTGLDTNKWTEFYSVAGQGTITVSNGICRLEPAASVSNAVAIVSQQTFTAGIIIEMRTKTLEEITALYTHTGLGSNAIAFSAMDIMADNGYNLRLQDSSSAIINVISSGTETQLQSGLSYGSPTVWHLQKFIYTDNGTIRVFYDNTQIGVDSFNDTFLNTNKVIVISQGEYSAGYGGGYRDIDWIRVRKYANPEPVSTIGTEELNPFNYSTITPLQPYSNQSITCTNSSEVSDLDGDAVSFTFIWYKNGAVISGVNTSTLDSSYYIKNDNITCSIAPYDGYETGVYGNSSTVTILNSAPVLNWIHPQNDSYIAKNYLVINTTASDVDNDPITFYFYGDAVNASTLINTSSTSTYNWTGLNDTTTYYITVKAGDGEANSSLTVRQFTVDLTTPLLSLSTPLNSTLYVKRNTTFSWIQTDNVGFNHTELFIDSVSNATITNLANGTNTYTVLLPYGKRNYSLKVVDKAGWINTSQTRTFYSGCVPVGNICYTTRDVDVVENISTSSSWLIANGTNLSFTSSGMVLVNTSFINGTTTGIVKSIDSLSMRLTTSPYSLYYNSSKNEGKLLPVWNSSTIWLNYSTSFTCNQSWYSLNGGSNITLDCQNAIVSPVDGYNNITLYANDSSGNIYSLLWEFINANKTIYSNLWHTIYASGAIEREKIFQNGSFDNYSNISDRINVVVSNGSANFYATVPQVNSMFFNLSGSGNNVTITVTGTPVNSVWLRYKDGLFNGSVTVRLDGIFNDTISLSSHTLNYTRVPLVENLTASPSSISQGDSVTVTVDIIESVGSISTVVLENTETGINYSMSLDSGNTYTTYIPGSDLQQVGTHTLRVYATNSFGNTNGLMTIPLTVQQSSGVIGGGGSGGSGGAPFGIEPSKKWCQALSAYIDANKWSEELCSVLEGTVPEVRNAEIIYFVTNFYKKGYCSATRGKAPLVDCHEEEVKAGEVIYAEGYAYSTSGIVFPQSYKWNLINLKNNLSVSSFNGRSIQFTVLEPGEYFLALVVTDTQNLSYITNYTFKVVKPVTDEEVSSWKSLLSSLRNKSEEEVLPNNESDGLATGVPLLPKEPVEKLIGGELDSKRMLLISASFILSLALIYRIFFIRRE